MEMDEQRMSFASLPDYLKLPDLLLHLALGFGVGRLYFYGVWQSANIFQDSISAALMWTALRFGLLAVALLAIALEGALPLLVTALGILTARHVALRAMQ
jgi:N-ATPase, AtpR subunit